MPSPGEHGTHFVLMVVHDRRNTANRCFTVTPGTDITMTELFEETYARIRADNPHLRNPIVTYFDVRPNKIL